MKGRAGQDRSKQMKGPLLLHGTAGQNYPKEHKVHLQQPLVFVTINGENQSSHIDERKIFVQPGSSVEISRIQYPISYQKLGSNEVRLRSRALSRLQ